MNWILENWGTLLVGGVVLAVVLAIVLRLIRNKKEGKTSCGCGCEGCALRDKCHPQK